MTRDNVASSGFTVCKRKENRQRKCETVADRWRVIIVYRTTRAVMINNNSVFMDVGLTADVMCVYFEKW